MKTIEIMTLCNRCKQDFETAGTKLIKTNSNIKETCDFCNHRQGFTYELHTKDK